jgi:flagellin
MANIGATTAFYKVETSLTRANNEVSKSMERLATGKQNATAGDRSSYQAMADTCRLDYVATKAGIKGASVVMGYLETAMRTLDAASGVLSRLQELAVLAANDSNTDADLEAIDAEAEALGDEFHRLLSTAKYKGKDLFLDAAGGEYVSLGGRDAEMTFGVKKIQYSKLYLHDYAAYGNENGVDMSGDAEKDIYNVKDAIKTRSVVNNMKYETWDNTVTDSSATNDVVDLGGVASASDVLAKTDTNGDTEGDKWTATGRAQLASGAQVAKQTGQLLFAASEGLIGTVNTDLLIDEVEAVQAKINTARVQAGSQYAALESAVGYVTDLTAQYELGYNAVNDVNFSMETAHLAKNQILQQAATAMLAQANQGQQSLLQLIQG